MTHRDHQHEQIAAYIAGRLSAGDVADFERRMHADPEFAAEVESLSGVAGWLADGFSSGPSASYRLSDDRLSVIRATARGDIVSFPRTAPAANKPSRVGRFARRYGLAAAAALAMMIGAVSGFESGRVQVSESSRPILVAVDIDDATSRDAGIDTVYVYPPAYGLDHADLLAMAANAGPIRFASEPHRDYGLPGPGSPYLRSGEVLFLQ